MSESLIFASAVPFGAFPFPSRLFGLKDIIKPGNCSSAYEVQLNAGYDWPVYVSPGILFLLYLSLAAVLKTESYASAHQVSFWPPKLLNHFGS